MLVGTAHPASVISYLDQFTDAVREQIGIEDTLLLPDSTLIRLSREAILWTSVDAGGVELQHSFITSEGTGRYALPDTVTEVLFGTLIDENGGTRTLKAIHPQFVEDLGYPTNLESNVGKDALPMAYSCWADTVQLIPVPSKSTDTVILKCWVEHPAMDTSGHVGGDSAIYLRPAYTEAAKAYACYKALWSVDEFEKGKLYLGLYDKKRTSLREVYRKRFDILQNE